MTVLCISITVLHYNYCMLPFRLRQGQHGRAYRHGLTVPIFSCSTAVPCGTAHPCQVAGTLVRDSSPGRSLTGPVRSGPGISRSGPVQDRSRTVPVLGPWGEQKPVFGPGRSGLVRSGPGPMPTPKYYDQILGKPKSVLLTFQPF